MTDQVTTSDVEAYEHATWERCAPGYADGFALLTREATGPLLDAAAVGPGSRVLDVGAGTGLVAAAAAARGATVIGVDFADAMLDQARTAVPGVEFRSASADSLPFGDATFQAVVANAVLHHLARPERSLAEALRVLEPGGRFAGTVWADPQSLEAFGLFFAAVAEHAGEATLPHGPLFGVTDAKVLTSLLVDAGFISARVEPMPAVWRLPSIDTLLRALGTWAQLDTFPQPVRQAIDASVRSAADAYRTADGLVIPNPMLLITAAKPV